MMHAAYCSLLLYVFLVSLLVPNGSVFDEHTVCIFSIPSCWYCLTTRARTMLNFLLCRKLQGLFHLLIHWNVGRISICGFFYSRSSIYGVIVSVGLISVVDAIAGSLFWVFTSPAIPSDPRDCRRSSCT
ncbi:hypothetical protein BT96DRAFT_182719 [Gymnopus androsaceus JB14]|uniref:Uncharacterized protein n=1 Tax=Gymnopus androsaceus JB14 TaxID=1447944 RepID=A0A6A4HAB9_9AGAR|nr:hypothetical protein BT96DRAFT_182719 [Gymnopus androsaceus JB14]